VDGAALVGAAGRWAGYAGMLAVVGATVFRFGVLRATGGLAAPAAPVAARRAATLGLVAALVMLVAATARLHAQVAAWLDPGEAVTGELLGLILRETTWGRGWTSQVVAAGLGLAAFGVARVAPGPGWLMAAAAASAAALAAPLTGHATGERAGTWGYPLDVLHVLGAGAWLGTLAAVVIAGLSSTRTLPADARDDRVARLVNAFSPIALAGAGTAVLAGVGLALRYLEGSVSALWTTPYGRTLLLKLLVLGLVMAVGAWNWRVGRPRLGDAPGSARIRRSSLGELALATVLLAVAAALTSQPLPGAE
jgi:putative copper export protein